MRIIKYLFCVTIVLITTRPILTLPRPTFVDESHKSKCTPRNGSLNATVSLARAFSARTSHGVTSKRHNDPGFANPRAAAPVNISYPTDSSSSVQQNSQWGIDGISTVVFGCIGSILGMLAIWATLWLGNRQFGSSSMPQPRLLQLRLTPSIQGPDADHSDELRLQELPTDQPSHIATAGSSEGRLQDESLEAPTRSVAGG